MNFPASRPLAHGASGEGRASQSARCAIGLGARKGTHLVSVRFLGKTSTKPGVASSNLASRTATTVRGRSAHVGPDRIPLPHPDVPGATIRLPERCSNCRRNGHRRNQCSVCRCGEPGKRGGGVVACADHYPKAVS